MKSFSLLYFIVFQCIVTTTISSETEPPSSSLSPSPSEDCSAPCPPLDDPFCFGIRGEDCICQTACCSLQFCETGIDWEKCVSCFECPCLPEVSSSPSCNINCVNKRGCSVKVNMDLCICEYNCPTPY